MLADNPRSLIGACAAVWPAPVAKVGPLASGPVESGFPRGQALALDTAVPAGG